MIEPHVHCGFCGVVMETTIKCRDGKTKKLQLEMRGKLSAVMGPEGAGIGAMPVPACERCCVEIEAAQEKSKPAPPRLVVPRIGGAVKP